MGLATRHEAIDHNRLRDVSPIALERKETRSLTLDEVRRLRSALRRDEKAVDRDVPALVDFMLDTGMRIGEVLTVTWDALDLKAGTVEMRATVVRKGGEGLILQREYDARYVPRSEAGESEGGGTARGDRQRTAIKCGKGVVMILIRSRHTFSTSYYARPKGFEPLTF
ncbi:tyrosine-type recombinase/integrase [Saccharomonospora xinjiangensis]|uniref:tyrosine-type recombinase/integrase n=1 Tax=Saccharomonospora xinjiangensis TaxID=75294 RepID=UPI0039EA09A9